MKPGERIKLLRRGKGLTQEKFAKILKVSRGFLGQIETDVSRPSREFLKKLNAAFGVSSDYILYGTPQSQGVEELSALIDRIRDSLEQSAKLGVLPRAIISDDEIAIIKTLRLLSIKYSIKLLRKVVLKIEKDPSTPRDDYSDQYINRLKTVIERGHWEIGIDFEGILWGYEKIKDKITH